LTEEDIDIPVYYTSKVIAWMYDFTISSQDEIECPVINQWYDFYKVPEIISSSTYYLD